MRKITLLLIVSLLLSFVGNAQSFRQNEIGYKSKRSNLVSLNPLSFIFNLVNISYERRIDSTTSAVVGLIAGGEASTNLYSFNMKNVLSLTAEYRLYVLSDGGLNGLFVSPYLRYAQFNASKTESTYDAINFTYNTSTTLNANIRNIQGGVLFGYQAVVADRISFQAFLGPGYNLADGSFTTGDSNKFKDEGYRLGGRTWFRAGIGLGFKF